MKKVKRGNVKLTNVLVSSFHIFKLLCWIASGVNYFIIYCNSKRAYFWNVSRLYFSKGKRNPLISLHMVSSLYNGMDMQQIHHYYFMEFFHFQVSPASPSCMHFEQKRVWLFVWSFILGWGEVHLSFKIIYTHQQKKNLFYL